MACGTTARGHETRIACPPDSALAERAAGRVAVEPLPWRRQLGWQSLRRMIHLLRELRPEVVHLHSAHAHSLGAIAARVVRTPVVVASKRTDYLPRPGRLNRLRYQRWVDKVIAISEGARQAVISSGISPEAVVTIHSSVDCARFRPARDRSAARAALGLSDDEQTTWVRGVAGVRDPDGHRPAPAMRRGLGPRGSPALGRWRERWRRLPAPTRPVPCGGLPGT